MAAAKSQVSSGFWRQTEPGAIYRDGLVQAHDRSQAQVTGGLLCRLLIGSSQATSQAVSTHICGL